LKLVLYEDVIGEKVTQYYAAGHPDDDLLICFDWDAYHEGRTVWRNKRRRRVGGGPWETLPGEYASADEAKAALE
jgi:hypothetical protein